jgi:murein DD-endopeptidase MepM/ murein hydrolase activator NlpD
LKKGSKNVKIIVPMTMEKIIRLVMVFSLIYFFPVSGLFHGLVGYRGGSHEPQNARADEPENGMGMPYIEEASLSLPVLDAGAIEPQAYSKPQMLLCFSYTVRQGDTIGELAETFGLNQDTLLSLNGIKNARLLQIGQVLKIPNQDGILYKVQSGDTLNGIAEKYELDSGTIRTTNELFSDKINVSTNIFLPGARLSRTDIQEINGDLFIWPVRGYITSSYGYRASPFTGARQFHTGLDIGAAQGTPIRAAMAGRVSGTGYDGVSGNYVAIAHHSGYRTLYAHMSVIRIKTGTYVKTGDIIGDVGNTGLSTGPHLHFTVYKNGVTVNPRALIK